MAGLGFGNSIAPGLGDWVDRRRNAGLGFAAGLLGGNDWGSGLSQGFSNAQQGLQTDNAYAQMQQAEQQKQEQLNQTIQWLQQKGRDDLIPLVNAGQASTALTEAMKAPEINAYDTRFAEGQRYGLAGDALNTFALTGNLPSDSQKSPYAGTGMDAQNANILLTGDPSSPEYAYAYNLATQPRMTFQQTANGLVPVYETPKLPPSVRAPAGMQASAPAQVVPQSIADAPRAGGWGAPMPSFGAQPAAGGLQTGPVIPGTKKPATEMEARNKALATIALNEVPTVHANFSALSDPKGQLLSKLGPLGNPWQSADYQQAANSLASTISTVLYSLSGASSNPGEVVKQIEILTPQLGDKPDVIADKLRRFDTYVTAIASESGDPELIAMAKKIVGDANAKSGSAASGKTSTGVPWSVN